MYPIWPGQQGGFVNETTVNIRSPEGTMPTYIVRPEADGPWPTALMLMDGLSLRPALRDMASRLATAGYYVALPYLYYRSGPYREFSTDPEDVKARRECMAEVTPPRVLSDMRALLGYLGDDAASRDGALGVFGYCLGGALALHVAAAFPQVAGIGVIHGSSLVTGTSDSPHRVVDSIKGEVYVAWADEDPHAPKEDLPIVRDAFADAGVRASFDFMTGAHHGFAAPIGEPYDRTASERHWERLHDLFGRTLR
jgi:carboxymethylenebutenolidase